EPVAQIEGPVLNFERRTLDGENHYAAALRFETAVRIEPAGDSGYRVTNTEPGPLKMLIEAGEDYPVLTPLPVEQMIQPSVLQRYEAAQAKAEDSWLKEAIDRFRFLAYREKMLAGSHRFLTYFGRDTLITNLLAWRYLTPRVRESALRSVLDRLS